jgi:UMF1 family MFS transporter
MRTMVLEVSVPRVVLTRLLGRAWRAAYFGPASPLRLVDLPDPPLPAPDWVRVRNRLCGICGSDLPQLFLDAGLDVAPVALPSHRRVYLGHEMGGEVLEAGDAVGDFGVGDRVVRWGRADDCRARGRAELCPACRCGHRVLCQFASEPRQHEPVGGGFGDTFITPASTLLPVPAGLSDEQAIFAEPAAVAIHAAWRRPAEPGERVLVLGCGTIGFLLIQAVRTLQPECQISAVAQFPWQAEQARNYGADAVFLSRDDGYAETARLTGARLYTGRSGNRMLLGGFDLIFDVVGIGATLNDALRWTRAGGTVTQYPISHHKRRAKMTTAAAAPLSTRRERWAWYLYDFGNSAYASVVLLAVYSAYFKEQVVGGAEGTRLWGTAVFIAMLVVAVTAPILGTLADFAGSKKRFLFFFTAMACLFTAGLFFARPGMILVGMGFFVLAEIGYRSAQVFYDGLLPEIAAPHEMGRISGNGWAIGTAGGIVVLLLILPLNQMVEGNLSARLSMIVTAMFFVVFALPVFHWLRERAQRQPLPAGKNYLTLAFRRLQSTFRATRGFREFLKFMLAFLIYNDGIIMALDFSAIIGAVLFGLDQQQLIFFFIVVQLTNVVGAFLFGHLVDRIGGKSSLVLSLLLMIGVVIWLFFNQTLTGFFVLGGVAGVAMAGAQSISRTLVAIFAPPGKSAEFYGFFAMAGRTSSFIGPAVYGWLAAEAALWYEAHGQATVLAEQSGQRLAILSIAVFLAVGLVLLTFVNEKKARAAARGIPD